MLTVLPAIMCQLCNAIKMAYCMNGVRLNIHTDSPRVNLKQLQIYDHPMAAQCPKLL
jgi:hypothetical protein